MKTTVILTAAMLCVLSPISYAVEAAPSSAEEKTSAKPLRILCVGDSITAGYTDNPKWDVPFEFGYRQGLFERLQKAGYQISASSGVRRGGWRSPGPSSPAITLWRLKWLTCGLIDSSAWQIACRRATNPHQYRDKKIGTFDFRSARSGEASDQREMNHKANS